MSLQHTMRPRHLDTQEFSLAAIDDIISRGQHQDWLELRDAIRTNPEVAEKVKRICEHYEDQDSLRYDFWPVYLRLNGYAHLYE